MSEMQALGCTHPYAHERRVLCCCHDTLYTGPIAGPHAPKFRFGWWCLICEREIHPGSPGIISKWAAPPGALSLCEPAVDGGLSLTPNAGAISVARTSEELWTDLRDTLDKISKRQHNLREKLE